MGLSCIAIKGTKQDPYVPSKIYETLDFITKDKKLSLLLWGLSLDSSHLEKIGLPTDRDTTPEEYIKRNGYIYDMLTDDFLKARYINYVNNFYNNSYPHHNNAVSVANTILEQYPQFSVNIFYSDGKYKITVEPKNEHNKNSLEMENALSALNNKLISFIERLGFAVKEVEELTTPGVFAPKDAITNAEGLIEAILISKGILGKKAIPEEISHLLIAGLHNNPLVLRLKTLLNEGAVKELLGEQYLNYYNKYNDNTERLKEEVIGKLLAESLKNKSGIQESVKTLSSRIENVVMGNLRKGDESRLLEYLQETLVLIEQLSEGILNQKEDFVGNLDVEAILSHEELYNLDNQISKLQELANSSYEIFAKKVKLDSFKSRTIASKNELVLDTLEQDFQKSKYNKGCVDFLKAVMEDCTDIYEDIKDIKSDIEESENEKVKMVVLKHSMKSLNRLNTFIEAYSDIVELYESISEIEGIEEELSLKDIEKLEKMASEINKVIKKSKKLYKNLRFYTLLDFYKQFWKEDILIKNNGEETRITLEDILLSQMGDTTAFDRMVSSIADSKDPLLQLVNTAFQDEKFKMDAEAVRFELAIAQIEQEYYETTGSRDTSFMYDKDKDGNLTGMYISDRDYNAYHKAHRQEYEKFKALGLDKVRIEARMHQWRKRNTETVSIFGGRKERMPKKSLYPSNALQSLDTALLKYYNDIIAIKKQLFAMVPGKGSGLYKAPLKRISGSDALLQKRNPKAFLQRIKEKYITTDVEDFDYGELLLGERYVVLDFQGKEVKRVPVYYNTRLEDMSQLDTNTGDAMIAYANMAVHYKHMNNIADTIELTSSLFEDRKIIQMKGAKKLFYKYKVGNRTIEGDHTVKGKDTELYQLLRGFIDANIYRERKKLELFTFKYGNKQYDINYGNIGDTIKKYSTLVGMGLSEFSATSNVLMGEIQLLRESVGAGYFNLKDLLWAHKEYWKLRPSNAANAYSNTPNDKLTLLLKKFDCLNDLERDMNSTTYSNGMFRRIGNKFNLMIGNLLGEHYLRSLGMLAVLKQLKVRYKGKEVSLYDVMEVKDIEHNVKTLTHTVETKHYDIVIPKEVTDLLGNNLNLKAITELIQEANRVTLGGYAESDKGTIYRTALGRNLMLYRQWMPASYTTRFGGTKLNTRTGTLTEGSYVTAFKFLLGTLLDLKHFKFNLGSRWSVLLEYEKLNMKKAIFDTLLLLLLVWVLPSKESKDDDEDNLVWGRMNPVDGEDPWYTNKVKLLLLRTKLELSALTPSLGGVKSIFKIILTPLPAMENLNNAIGLLDISSVGDEIGKGKYEGWSKWAKTLYLSIPGTRNVNRFVDLLEGETDMFRPYLN